MIFLVITRHIPTLCVGTFEADLTVVTLASEKASSTVILNLNPATDMLLITGNVVKSEFSISRVVC